MPSTSHPIRSDITAGSVYYYNDPDLKSAYRHFCIVLNIDPSKDTVIFLAYASHRISKVRERRKDCPEETLVELTPQQYLGFDKKSIVDCNVVLERGINTLIGLFDRGKLIIKPMMGLRLVRLLRKGVIASEQVSSRIQQLLKDKTKRPCNSKVKKSSN